VVCGVVCDVVGVVHCTRLHKVVFNQISNDGWYTSYIFIYIYVCVYVYMCVCVSGGRTARRRAQKSLALIRGSEQPELSERNRAHDDRQVHVCV
jgi:hypothetical protein